MYFPLEAADGGGLALERLPSHQSLHPQIAVHAALLMLFGVSHEFLQFGCVLQALCATPSVLLANYPRFFYANSRTV